MLSFWSIFFCNSLKRPGPRSILTCTIGKVKKFYMNDYLFIYLHIYLSPISISISPLLHHFLPDFASLVVVVPIFLSPRAPAALRPLDPQGLEPRHLLAHRLPAHLRSKE